MKIFVHKIKDKMLEFTKLFCIETNFFQRFVIVYKYFKFLNTEPIVKDVLQKIFDDTAKIIGEPEENMDEDKFLNVKGDFYFSEIAEDEFHELDYKADPDNWKRYRRTCEYINDKIEEQTKNSIKDFMIFNSGRKAKVKVNQKYI